MKCGDKAYEKAKALLESKRAAIEKIAKILLEKEVLEGDELRRFIEQEGKDRAKVEDEALLT